MTPLSWLGDVLAEAVGAKPLGPCASLVDLGGTKEDLAGLGPGCAIGLAAEEHEPAPSPLGPAPSGMVLFDCK